MSQFYVFLVCVLIGAAGGALYDAVALLRLPFRAKWVHWVSDGLFCLLFAAGYLGVSVALMLPSARFYMCAALILGFVLYLKSFHKIVAFAAKKVYNICKKSRKERRICPKG